jgi:hypothetical protein
MTTDDIARKLKDFAEQVCRSESPLYEQLCLSMADDRPLLRLLQIGQSGQPVPNLLLAAVHYLLLSGSGHELGDFYRSCVAVPRPPQQAYGAFREFCLSNEAAIGELMSTRRVQTNEVRRCTYLLPAFAWIARHGQQRPLALIEVGTSAGLNLNWDRYHYDYGGGRLCGPCDARVRLSTECRRRRYPQLPDDPPAVVQRVGVDRQLVRATDAGDVLWLRSLVWPDQPQRMELLLAAIGELRDDPPQLVEADAFDTLPRLIRRAPDEATLCVFHCHTLNQFSDEQRTAFDELLASASRERPFIQLSAEWIRTATPELHVCDWTGGERRGVYLANVDHHGRWLEWLRDDPAPHVP